MQSQDDHHRGDTTDRMPGAWRVADTCSLGGTQQPLHDGTGATGLHVAPNNLHHGGRVHVRFELSTVL